MARSYEHFSKRALLERILETLDRQGKTLTKLDDAVATIAEIVTAEVADLRSKLAAAQADDATAAAAAADVEENIARLEALGTQLQAGDVPADVPPGTPDTPPTDGTPISDVPGDTTPVTGSDGTVSEGGAGASGIPSGGEPGTPDLGDGTTL